MLLAKKNIPVEVLPEVENLPTDINIYMSSFTRFTDTSPQGNGIYNFLGYGYDVTDKYNSEWAVKLNVINTSSFVLDHPSRFDLGKSTTSYSVNKAATDAEDLSGQLSNQFTATQGLKLFKNTLTSVGLDKSLHQKYVYGYFSYYWSWKRRTFYYGQEVNNYLTDDFRRDVVLLDVKELVNKYGTHVLTRISLGSKLDVIYQADVSANSNREDVCKEGLRYVLEKTFGFSINYGGLPNLKNLNANSYASIYYRPVGGDLRTLKLENIGYKQVLNVSNWMTSAAGDNIEFIGPMSNGLEPLYKFIDNAEKKDLVKSYLEEYYSTKAVKLKK